MEQYKLSGFSDEISSDTTVQFEVLNKLGIKYFESRGIDGKNISLLSDDEAAALRAKMDSYGIKASSIGSPIGKIKLGDDFEEHFALFKRVVNIAKILGTKYIRVFSFYSDSGSWSEDDRNQVLSRLRRMIDYAAEENVILLHENEKDIYGDVADRCLDLMKELACDNFKAVFDPANFVQCGEDTNRAFELLKDYVAYVHIKDARSKDGMVVPSGMGDGNVEYVLKKLFDNGYCGFLSLEPHLGQFEGLAELEFGDVMKNLPKGGEATFTLALNSLEKILNNILEEAK